MRINVMSILHYNIVYVQFICFMLLLNHGIYNNYYNYINKVNILLLLINIYFGNRGKAFFLFKFKCDRI